MIILNVKVYKRLLKAASEKYEGAEVYINSWIDEICSQEKLFPKEVMYFLCFLLAF